MAAARVAWRRSVPWWAVVGCGGLWWAVVVADGRGSRSVAVVVVSIGLPLRRIPATAAGPGSAAARRATPRRAAP